MIMIIIVISTIIMSKIQMISIRIFIQYWKLKGLIINLVFFDRIQDRNDAALLTNKKVAINRHELPELPDGQYYWADLIGSKVYNLTGAMLGLLDHVFTTGANDIMVVKKNNNNSNVNNTSKHNNKDYLIPYKKEEFVVDIDLINKKLIVNWDL